MIWELSELVADVTKAFEKYDYARALERTEAFFWSFCDDYIELVKIRAYADGEGATSARAALALALSVLQRLFAPFLPFATEEVWSWWHDGSVHLAPWPTSDEFGDVVTDELGRSVYRETKDVLGVVRRTKSEAKVSMRAEVATVEIGQASVGRAVAFAEQDLKDAGAVLEVVYHNGEDATVVAHLAPIND
jgi:valyl-tRNA synthetase